MDRHDLYELCVQSPRHAVDMLRAIHGAEPVVLAEDFCGTAAVSREWAGRAGCRALGVDIDPEVLERARARLAEGARVRLVRRDATGESGDDEPADVIFVGNFSIGEIRERPALVAYLRRARDRLAPGGVFVCDTYGGESAYRIGGVTRKHGAPDGSIVHCTWEQRRADGATGMVENALHFRVIRAGEVVSEWPEAFVYRWRLWSVPELRDAITEAGFAGTSVHQSLGGEPSAHGQLGAGYYIVCVAGRG